MKVIHFYGSLGSFDFNFNPNCPVPIFMDWKTYFGRKPWLAWPLPWLAEYLPNCSCEYGKWHPRRAKALSISVSPFFLAGRTPRGEAEKGSRKGGGKIHRLKEKGFSAFRFGKSYSLSLTHTAFPFTTLPLQKSSTAANAYVAAGRDRYLSVGAVCRYR